MLKTRPKSILRQLLVKKCFLTDYALGYYNIDSLNKVVLWQPKESCL